MEWVVRGEADAGEHLLAMGRDDPGGASRRGLRECRGEDSRSCRLAAPSVASRASTATSASASRWRTAWNDAIGRPNWTRSSAWVRARSSIVATAPGDLVGDGPSARRDRRRPSRRGRSSPRPPRACSARTRWKPASGSMPSTLRISAVEPATVIALASSPVLHTTTNSRATAAREVASPTATHRSAPMCPGTRHVPNWGRSTARSGRGVMPSADTTTSSSTDAARFVRPSAVKTMSTASRGSVSSISSHPRPVSAASTSAGPPPVPSASSTVDRQQLPVRRVHHASAPRSSSRRAMMLRWTSAVPP